MPSFLQYIHQAISSEHAYIEYDEDTETFYLIDGALGPNGKASTNGTWYRLRYYLLG